MRTESTIPSEPRPFEATTSFERTAYDESLAFTPTTTREIATAFGFPIGIALAMTVIGISPAFSIAFICIAAPIWLMWNSRPSKHKPVQPGDRMSTLVVYSDIATKEPREVDFNLTNFSALINALRPSLTELETNVLRLHLDGESFEQIGDQLNCDAKTVDNAFQRVSRRVNDLHLPVR